MSIVPIGKGRFDSFSFKFRAKSSNYLPAVWQTNQTGYSIMCCVFQSKLSGGTSKSSTQG